MINRTKFSIAILFVFYTLNLSAQNYFQQLVNYQIKVKLDDVKHELRAFETIEYTNNSKDALNEIRMHIWPNGYSNNETALAKQLVKNKEDEFDFTDEKIRGYIDSLDFKVDGKTVKWKLDSVHIEIVHIYLTKALSPGNKISISTPFHVKIPDGMISRMGHLEQSYQISQWYPKLAVYDRNGWNDMPYLNQGEFYSEYGTYEVSISLPENYVVGATGDLQDEREINWLNKKALESDTSNFQDRDLTFTKSDEKFKTITYKQSAIHDFAWFADKRFHVLKGEVVLPHNKKTVTLWSMFTNEEASLWKKSISYLHDAIYYYSLWLGDYPYAQATAVYGSISAGGGMEYPNITVIGKSKKAFLLDVVIAHEIGHNWFYGILGSNEREHAWMDEGINSYYENRYVEQKYVQGTDSSMNEISSSINLPIKEIKIITHKDIFELEYLLSARMGNDQPIELTADEFSATNYGTIVYAKTALVFTYLADYLGKENFDKAMQEYYEQWKFKHPMPSDIKKSFEVSTGKNLDWFFNEIINTRKKLDYKISAYKKRKNKIRIENFSDFSYPFSISGIKNKKPVNTIWNEGFTGIKEIDFPSGNYDKLVIDLNKNMPDINRQNNTLRTKGIFRKIEPLQLKFLAGFENPSKTQIFYMPAFGWNSYNRWMAGMTFYNSILPSKNFEYVIMPLYSFQSKNLCGGMDLSYRFNMDESILKSVKIGFKGSTYGYENFAYNIMKNGSSIEHSMPLKYAKYAPYMNIEFRKSKNSDIENTVSLRSVLLAEEKTFYSYIRKEMFVYNVNSQISEITYKIQNKKSETPWQLQFNFQAAENFAKVFAEANYSIPYNKDGKEIHIRFFTGKLLSDNSSDYFFKMNGWKGSQDNLYDYTFIGRTESKYLPSRQFVETDGGFKLGTNIGRSNNWIAAMNIKIPFPGWIPGGIFADTGTYEGSTNAFPGSKTIMYDAGIMFNVGKILEIYIPLTASSDILNEQKINGKKTSDQIRFTFYIDRLNPLEIIKNKIF